MKLIVSDIDGTLLHPGAQQLDEYTINVLEKFIKKGIIVVAASGRQYENMKQIFGRIQHQIVYIGENGGVVFDKDVLMYKKIIPTNIRNEIIEEVEREQTAELLISGVTQAYICPKSDYFQSLVKDRMKNNALITSNLLEVEESVKFSIYEEKKVSSFTEAYWKKKYNKSLTIVKSSEKWLDFMPLHTNKSVALKKVLEKYEIQETECLAFGDHDNDVEMLRMIPKSFAMTHGTKKAKEAASYETAHVEDILELLGKTI